MSSLHPSHAGAPSSSAAGGGSATSGGGTTMSASSTKDSFNLALRARNPHNNYIAHLKIWETVPASEAPTGAAPARKARYLILAVQRDSGRVTLNKAKRNANGSFSIGKDWDLNTLREVIVTEPDAFTLTLTRSYSWQTERAREQLLFLQSLVKVYRKYTRDLQGPRLEGLEVPDQQHQQQAEPQPAPPSAASTLVPEQPAPSRQGLGLNTTVPRESSRRSPLSPSGSRGTLAGAAAADGFYDPRSRGDNATPVSLHGGAVAEGGASQESPAAPPRPSVRRRPTQTSLDDKQPSNNAAPTTAIPAINLQTPSTPSTDDRNGAPTGAMQPPTRERSPLGSKVETPPRSRERSTTSSNDVGSTSTSPSKAGTAAAAPSSRSTSLAKPPSTTTRKTSADSVSTSSTLGIPSSGGDARARLSAVEPVRGGAAYEKMLLAGTGLKGVAEADADEEDDEEDPYGGAEISDVAQDERSPSALAGAGAGERFNAAAQQRRAKRMTRMGSKQSGSAANDANGGAGKAEELLEDDEEDTTLLNVEEMLEGFQWRQPGGPNGALMSASMSADGGGGAGGAMGRWAPSSHAGIGGKGTADVIEARLLDELAALDAANIHAIIESDDRVQWVVQHMEEALQQLDAIDSMIAGFKVQLNSRAEDISHIESQNRGLQVQTSNQRTLHAEIEKLLSTVHVDEGAVQALRYAGLADDQGIAEAEMAASALYKAILQATQTDDERRGLGQEPTMAAATERADEYQHLAEEFSRRLLAHLETEFERQKDIILSDSARNKALLPPHPVLRDHTTVEDALGRYCGILLYVKEVCPPLFARISAAYFASASERYRNEMARLLNSLRSQARKPGDDEAQEYSFAMPGPSGGGTASAAAAALRSGTIRRVGGGRGDRQAKGSKGPGEAEVAGHQAFARALSSITPLVWREQAFISDLLHINDNHVTFADYMALEPYFRRRAALIYGDDPKAANGAGGAGQLRDMRGALELVFGFLAPEWQGFADAVVQKDPIQIVGILAALDRAIIEAEDASSEFLTRNLSKLHTRMAAMLERFVGDQIRAIEQTKLSVKKRKGVVHFVRVLPAFVDRVEGQLQDCEGLNIRAAVDGYYEQICRTMFEALQAMAKMDGANNLDEDKSALNHHVILIENMHHFVKEVGKFKAPAIGPLVRRAEAIYEEHKGAYVLAVLRRPIGKMMDYGDGIDSLLRSTPSNEVTLHSAYSKQSFKRLLKEYGPKDLRKAIETLSRRVQKHFGIDDDDLPGLTPLSAAAAAAGGLGGLGSLGNSSSGGAGGEAAADEAAEVLARIWRACEEAAIREVERLGRIARECYGPNASGGGGGVTLEIGVDDVRRCFGTYVPQTRRR